jgi:Abnormal spindle-like microcephaly-assoc'd, ASPM-SPD-2-Hydin/Beta-propeller repeat
MVHVYGYPTRLRMLLTLVLVVFAFLPLLNGTYAFGATKPAPVKVADEAMREIVNGSGYAIAGPVVFEENIGQVPANYGFLSHEGKVMALFSRGGLDLVLGGTGDETARVGLRLLGTRTETLPRGEGRLTSVSNYFIGNNPNGWIRHVPQDAEVVYHEIYPGIDLAFHGREAQLEHDFIVAAGANPRQIRFKMEGARTLALDKSGNLRIFAGPEAVVLRKPEAYQETARGRRPVEAEFEISPAGTVRFRIGAYDRSRELIIDPVFSFSTYLVGTSASSVVTAATTDAAGNVYVTGYAASGFPIVNGVQTTFIGAGNNAFISKFDPTGHNLLYSTYLGGAGYFGNAANTAAAIALDPSGNIIVAGTSEASDFPHAGAVPPVNCQLNTACVFITSLSADGSSLNYSGLIGGGGSVGSDYGNGGRIAVDGQGNAYIAGVTGDPNFQITPGTLANTVPGPPYGSGFVLKVDTAGALVYCTILPGTLPANPADITINVFVPSGVLVDASGQATIAGTAGPGLPTTTGVIQATFPNDLNNTLPNAGFVLQLNANASAINYATYVPGTDWLLGMTADANGNLYLSGVTGETNLPVSANAYQKTVQQYQSSGFVVKMSANGTAIPAATYLEGTAGASFNGIALDSNANIFVGGMTSSTDFPLVNPFVTQWVFGISNSDMVLAEMSPDLSSLVFGSFLSSTDQVYSAPQFYGLTVDSKDNLIVVGEVEATDFPTTVNSFQPTVTVSSNQFEQLGFVEKLDLATPAPSVCPSEWSISFGNMVPGESSTQTVNITNCGNAPLVISSVVPSVASITANSCGSTAPGSICPISVTYTAQDASPVTATLTLNDNAAISPQFIQLYAPGTGGIGLSGTSTGLPSATVSAGGTATFNLLIGGNNVGGTASLTCSNAPKGATCATPGSITLQPFAQPFSVTVSTTPRTAASSSGIGGSWTWALVVFGLVAFPAGERRRRVSHWCPRLVVALLIGASSCGGGGSGYVGLGRQNEKSSLLQNRPAAGARSGEGLLPPADTLALLAGRTKASVPTHARRSGLAF